MANVNSLFGQTTPKHFLEACGTEARDYFSRLFAGLDAEGLSYKMGTKNSIQTEGPPTGRYERVRGKDAGSVRSSATGATEDVRGTRVTVGTVVGLVAAGYDAERVLAAYPYLEKEDIAQALTYGAWRAEEREVDLVTT